MIPPPSLLLKWLCTWAFVFTSGAAGFMLPSLGAHLSLPLLPSGIAVAACIRWGRSMWPAVFIAGMCIDLWTGQSLQVSLCVGISSSSAAVATAWLLEWRSFDPNFGRAKDVPLFIVAAAGGMSLSALIGLQGFHWGGDPTAIRAESFIRWWSNTTAGVLLVGPMLVGLSRRSLSQFADHWPEGGAWLTGVVLCGLGTVEFDPTGVGRPSVLIVALFLIVVGSIRFGLVVAAFGAMLISTAAAFSFAFGRGVFGQLGELAGLATIWSFSAALTGLNLIITALLAERDAEGLKRLKAEQRYEQIFDGSPQPLWVHDPDSLRFLLVNEATVRQYGWSREEFLAESVSIVTAPGQVRVLPPCDRPLADDAAPEPFETRHQTREGRVLDVEVWTRSIDLAGRQAVLVFAIDVTDRRALGGALIDAVATEQRRISQEMHDGLGQELTGLALSARALATRAERTGQPMAESLGDIATLAASCIQSARHIAQGLSPLSDSDGSLPAALEALAARSSVGNTVVQFRSRLETSLAADLEVRNHLYRIAQEAVQNALKHAAARRIEIDLWAHSGGLSVSINDDGVGLGVGSHRSSGLGMRTMRFRASAIGGRLMIATRSDGGVTVACEVPQAQVHAEVAENWFH